MYSIFQNADHLPEHSWKNKDLRKGNSFQFRSNVFFLDWKGIQTGIHQNITSSNCQNQLQQTCHKTMPQQRLPLLVIAVSGGFLFCDRKVAFFWASMASKHSGHFRFRLGWRVKEQRIKGRGAASWRIGAREGIMDPDLRITTSSVWNLDTKRLNVQKPLGVSERIPPLLFGRPAASKPTAIFSPEGPEVLAGSFWQRNGDQKMIQSSSDALQRCQSCPTKLPSLGLEFCEFWL